MGKYKYWLGRLPGIGDATIYKLLSEFDNAEEVYRACVNKNTVFDDIVGANKIANVREYTKGYDADAEYSLLINKDIKMISYEEDNYPRRLCDNTVKPYVIYFKGRLPEDDVPSVAIIGARNCSEYGTYVADAFGEALASEGVNIISGMARGIDGISQRGALKAGGSTFAVLGSGVDVCYPLGNFKLYKEIQCNGGIISAFEPGTAPLKQQFPQRNKVVASLADIILVIEAREKSGTSITVDMALKMGKDVYAVPGRLTDRLSDGCNRLIREGAGIALSPEDILRELAVIWNKQLPTEKRNILNSIGKLSTGQKAKDTGVLRYLDSTPKTVEQIYSQYIRNNKSITYQEIMSELISYCAMGEVVQVGTGYFYKSI